LRFFAPSPSLSSSYRSIVSHFRYGLGWKLARPRAALSDILRMHDQIHSRRDGATVSNRNIFNAKANGNARERKVMRGVWTTSNVPNERREREREQAG